MSEPAQNEPSPLESRRERSLAPASARKVAPPPGPERSRAIGNFLRRALLLLFALGLVGAIVMAWMPKPIPVELTEAQRGTLLVTVDEDGRTRVKDRYVVSAPLMAHLGRIELNAGDRVEPGAVLARFVPIVRTFVPFVAGAGYMSRRHFLFYNVTGAFAWVTACVGAGYLFGGIPIVKDNFSLVTIGIVVVSIIPILLELTRRRREPPVEDQG